MNRLPYLSLVCYLISLLAPVGAVETRESAQRLVWLAQNEDHTLFILPLIPGLPLPHKRPDPIFLEAVLLSDACIMSRRWFIDEEENSLRIYNERNSQWLASQIPLNHYPNAEVLAYERSLLLDNQISLTETKRKTGKELIPTSWSQRIAHYHTLYEAGTWPLHQQLDGVLRRGTLSTPTYCAVSDDKWQLFWQEYQGTVSNENHDKAIRSIMDTVRDCSWSRLETSLTHYQHFLGHPVGQWSDTLFEAITHEQQRSPTVSVVVDAADCAGPTGLIQRLKHEGYQIQEVWSQGPRLSALLQQYQKTDFMTLIGKLFNTPQDHLLLSRILFHHTNQELAHIIPSLQSPALQRHLTESVNIMAQRDFTAVIDILMQYPHLAQNEDIHGILVAQGFHHINALTTRMRERSLAFHPRYFPVHKLIADMWSYHQTKGDIPPNELLSSLKILITTQQQWLNKQTADHARALRTCINTSGFPDAVSTCFMTLANEPHFSSDIDAIMRSYLDCAFDNKQIPLAGWFFGNDTETYNRAVNIILTCREKPLEHLAQFKAAIEKGTVSPELVEHTVSANDAKKRLDRLLDDMNLRPQDLIAKQPRSLVIFGKPGFLTLLDYTLHEANKEKREQAMQAMANFGTLGLDILEFRIKYADERTAILYNEALAFFLPINMFTAWSCN